VSDGSRGIPGRGRWCTLSDDVEVDPCPATGIGRSREDVALSDRVDLLLVCSSGGHLLQLSSLQGAWEDLSRAWVSFDKSDVRSLLAGETVYVAHGPTNRSVKNLARNLLLAFRVVRRTRPRVMVTTGAGVAVPFGAAARLYGAKLVYIESFTRIDSISLSCRILRPLLSRMYVQWPEAVSLVPEARYVGSVLSDPTSS
jgi:UDP-N-acetylglucosamine:LPS N-acetylglucosamine transferase